MKQVRAVGSAILLLICAGVSSQAQQPVITNINVAVPPLVNFSGTLTDAHGKPMSDSVAVTFSLYSEQTGGVALWMETQNLQPDNTGHYTVMLGSTSSTGLPAEIFVAGQAHWLGLRVEEQQEEQPRVLLVSAPYALKAGDAETIRGLPPSAFVAASDFNPSSNTTAVMKNGGASADLAGTGTKGFIPLWTTSTKLGSSALFQSASGNIGIGTQTPEAPLTGVSASTAGTGVYGSSTSTTGSTIGVAGATASSAGVGVFGNAFSTSGSSVGVEGKNASSAGIAIYGNATSKSGSTVGVAAESASSKGVGVDGVGVDMSAEGAVVTNRPIGAWGDTNAVPSGAIAVLGTADDGIGIVALNNSPNGYVTLGAQSSESTNSSFLIFHVGNTSFGGTCGIDMGGDLSCNGSISDVVSVDGARKVALYSTQSTENWFEDSGSGKLVNGIASVSFDATFAETVNAAIEYHVFLTPQGECEGLYVGKKTPEGFEVRELHGGHSAVSFDYRIMARRKGYEKIRLADVTEQIQQPVLRSARPAQMAESNGANDVARRRQ